MVQCHIISTLFKFGFTMTPKVKDLCMSSKKSAGLLHGVLSKARIEGLAG